MMMYLVLFICFFVLVLVLLKWNETTLLTKLWFLSFYMYLCVFCFSTAIKRLHRFTQHWPLVICDTLIFNMQQVCRYFLNFVFPGISYSRRFQVNKKTKALLWLVTHFETSVIQKFVLFMVQFFLKYLLCTLLCTLLCPQ